MQNAGRYIAYYTDTFGVERQAGHSLSEEAIKNSQIKKIENGEDKRFRYYKLVPVEVSVKVETVLTIKEIK